MTKACLSLSCHAMSKEPGVCESADDIVSIGEAEVEMEGVKDGPPQTADRTAAYFTEASYPQV